MSTRTKIPALLPDWLAGLYESYGAPMLAPREWDQGVRFFDGSHTIVRRHWVWWHDKRHHLIRIDQYNGHFETVVELEAASGELESAKTVASLTTPLHPTDGQVVGLMELVGFQR